jgi:hypothetical protein
MDPNSTASIFRSADGGERYGFEMLFGRSASRPQPGGTGCGISDFDHCFAFPIHSEVCYGRNTDPCSWGNMTLLNVTAGLGAVSPLPFGPRHRRVRPSPFFGLCDRLDYGMRLFLRPSILLRRNVCNPSIAARELNAPYFIGGSA